MSEGVDTLIVVACDKDRDACVRNLIDELQVDHVEILILVDDQVLNSQQFRDVHDASGRGISALAYDFAGEYTAIDLRSGLMKEGESLPLVVRDRRVGRHVGGGIRLSRAP